jgi:proline dehydrogenase
LLRSALLAAAASERVRDLVTRTPATRAIVDRYVAGTSVEDAVAAARALRAQGLLVTLDYLGEDTAAARQAEAVTAQYLQLLGKLAAEGLTEDGAVEVSVKPTAVGLLLADEGSGAEPGTLGERIATGHLERIAAAARDAGTTVTVDAEEHRTTSAGLRIAGALREKFPATGSVLQAALRRTEADARALAAPGVRVRLCKGAYAEPESAAYTARHDIDRSYARCLRILMSGPGYPMAATHDPRLIAIAGSLGRSRWDNSFEYQMLYGVRPDEQRRLAGGGAKVRVYLPYGSDWYPYLVRRLAERPANLALFLRSLGSSS